MKAGKREAKSPLVSSLMGKQGEEDLWQRCKAERGVWSAQMLDRFENTDLRRFGGLVHFNNRWLVSRDR